MFKYIICYISTTILLTSTICFSQDMSKMFTHYGKLDSAGNIIAVYTNYGGKVPEAGDVTIKNKGNYYTEMEVWEQTDNGVFPKWKWDWNTTKAVKRTMAEIKGSPEYQKAKLDRKIENQLTKKARKKALQAILDEDKPTEDETKIINDKLTELN